MIKVKNVQRVLTIITVCCSLFFWNCSFDAGTEVGNPAVVVGKVENSGKYALKDALVYLLPPDYSPVIDSALPYVETPEVFLSKSLENSTFKMVSKTDEHGNFILRNIPKEFSYNLYVTHPESGLIKLKKGVRISKDSLDLGVITVKQPTYAQISISDSIFQDSGFIVIQGTPIAIPVETTGLYVVPVPSDSSYIQYLNATSKKVSAVIFARLSDTDSTGDTLDLTGIEHVLIPPNLALTINGIKFNQASSPFEYSIGVDDTAAYIFAENAFSNKGHSLEYQFFDAEESRLEPWSQNNVFVVNITEPRRYALSCRARSSVSKQDVTLWSQSFVLILNKNQQDTSVATPGIPFIIDTTGSAGLEPFQFGVNQIFSEVLAFEYRLKWVTSSVTSFSQWTTDTTFSILFYSQGSYKIASQARQLSDTTIVSIWSDDLTFTLTK